MVSCCVQVHRMCKTLRAGKDRLAGRENVPLLLGVQLARRSAHISRKAHRPAIYRAAPKILRASAFSSSRLDPPHSWPRYTRSAGHKRPRRIAAFCAAPPCRRRPFRANCHRGHGKTHRTVAARACCLDRRLGLVPARRLSNSTICNTINSNRPFDGIRYPIIGVKRARARLRHDHAIERVDVAILEPSSKRR